MTSVMSASVTVMVALWVTGTVPVADDVGGGGGGFEAGAGAANLLRSFAAAATMRLTEPFPIN